MRRLQTKSGSHVTDFFRSCAGGVHLRVASKHDEHQTTLVFPSVEKENLMKQGSSWNSTGCYSTSLDLLRGTFVAEQEAFQAVVIC
jgi:hypothetical protein